jgi:hypothetical protein
LHSQSTTGSKIALDKRDAGTFFKSQSNPMTPNVRNLRPLARQALDRARAELASGTEERLRYAALELRQALEALTYDRGLAFSEFIPPEEYSTWQPRKLMNLLLEIDPSIEMTSTISFGRQIDADTSVPPEAMQTLGTDFALTLKDLKTHYDALGNYLHVPSLEQLISGKLPDMAKLHERCVTLISIVERVLSSTIWNPTFGSTTTMPACMNEECKKPVRKRIPMGTKSIEARCFACQAEYTIVQEEDGRWCWTPKWISAHCTTPECKEEFNLWPFEVKPGTNWRCRGCGTQHRIALGVERLPEPQ